LEICLKDLQEDFMGGAPIIVDEPVVSYCETATGEMEQGKTIMAKSANKHNKLYVWGGHLTEELVNAIDPMNGAAATIGAMDDVAARSKLLQEDHGWDKHEAKKIWAFGPNGRGANLMLESAHGAQYLNEIKDSVKMGFQNATGEGPLCEENMRGFRVHVIDVTLHADAIHRGMGQIMPCSRRACYAAMLSAGPAVMEPIFKAEISVPESYAGAIYPLLAQKMGVVIDDKQQLGTPMKVLTAHLPVAQSFGFTAQLRAATGGKAFPQMVFSHWAVVQGDMQQHTSMVNHVITKIRKRKGLKIVGPVMKNVSKKILPHPDSGWIPTASHYEDRM
jgi:elongation factor 2